MSDCVRRKCLWHNSPPPTLTFPPPYTHRYCCAISYQELPNSSPGIVAFWWEVCLCSLKLPVEYYMSRDLVFAGWRVRARERVSGWRFRRRLPHRSSHITDTCHRQLRLSHRFHTFKLWDAFKTALSLPVFLTASHVLFIVPTLDRCDLPRLQSSPYLSRALETGRSQENSSSRIVNCWVYGIYLNNTDTRGYCHVLRVDYCFTELYFCLTNYVIRFWWINLC